MAKRIPCPHCRRQTAVIGARGQLARHRCRDNPQTMTDVERVRQARHAVSGVLARRETAVELLNRAQRQLRRTRISLIFARLALGFAVVTLIERGLTPLTGIALAAGLFAAYLSGGSLRRGIDRVDARRRGLAAVSAEYDGALATLVEVESAVPDRVAWPEVFENLPDLDQSSE